MTIARIKEILKENGISITSNRIDVIRHLSDSHHFHSVSEIIKDSKDKLNKKSVYKGEGFLANISFYATKKDIDILQFFFCRIKKMH